MTGSNRPVTFRAVIVTVGMALGVAPAHAQWVEAPRSGWASGAEATGQWVSRLSSKDGRARLRGSER